MLISPSRPPYFCQPAARRPTSLRMEAEELEQLNPAIKGKRLEVVDEVRHESRDDGAAAALALVNGRRRRRIRRPKAAFHMSSTRSAAYFPMRYRCSRLEYARNIAWNMNMTGQRCLEVRVRYRSARPKNSVIAPPHYQRDQEQIRFSRLPEGRGEFRSE